MISTTTQYIYNIYKYHEISQKIYTSRKVQNFPHDLISWYDPPEIPRKYSTNFKLSHQKIRRKVSISHGDKYQYRLKI